MRLWTEIETRDSEEILVVYFEDGNNETYSMAFSGNCVDSPEKFRNTLVDAIYHITSMIQISKKITNENRP